METPHIYRRSELNPDRTVDPGQVVPRPDGGWALQCPCKFRTVYVNEPPFKLTFKEDGTLESLGGSCKSGGHTERGDMGLCHFTLTDGNKVEVHGDCTCPLVYAEEKEG